MQINGTVYVKSNVGLLIQKDSIASLVQYITSNTSTGKQKTVNQWYANEVVYDYFISIVDRDTYFTTYSSELVEGLYVFIKDIGFQKYTNSTWVTQSSNPSENTTVSDGITEIVNARNSQIYDTKFTNLDARLEHIEDVSHNGENLINAINEQLAEKNEFKQKQFIN